MKAFFIVIAIVAVAGAVFFIFFGNTLAPQLKIYQVAIVTRKDTVTYQEAILHYRKKMTELGYVEGRNIAYHVYEYANNSDLKQVIQSVIDIAPDVIHTYSTPATVEAYQRTKDMSRPISIVFGSMGDPIAAGVIKDIQNPGTNVTGVSSLSTELTANRLRLLKEIRPDIKRVAMPHSAESLNDAAANKSVEIARNTAKELGIELTLLPVIKQEENAIIAQKITRKEVEGMIVGGDSLIWGSIDVYIAQALNEKIPMAGFDVTQITKGALIGIGPDYARVGEQAATLTHRILNGASPASLPVQVPQKLILAVNVATARTIGITLSDDILKRADAIIGR